MIFSSIEHLISLNGVSPQLHRSSSDLGHGMVEGVTRFACACLLYSASDALASLFHNIVLVIEVPVLDVKWSLTSRSRCASVVFIEHQR